MHGSRVRGTRPAGFTLLEIVVVLLLVGILAALAAPSLNEIASRARRRGALDRIAGDLYYARILAVRHGERTVVRFSRRTDGSGCHAPSYTVAIRSTPERVAKRTELELRPATCLQLGSADSIVYNSRGLPASVNNRKVFVRDGGRVDSLTVSSLGRVYRGY